MCQFIETIAILDGKPQHLPFHQQRVAENATLDLQNFIHTLNVPSSDLHKLSIIYDSKKILTETITRYSIRPILSFKIVHNNEIEYSKKYADRLELELLVHQKGGCDEILIIKNGRVTDTSFSNIVFKSGNRWITPKNPLLKGTCRARLLENRIIEQEDLFLQDLLQFSHFMLINAMLDFDETRAQEIGIETFVI